MSKVANFKTYRDLCIEILKKEQLDKGGKLTILECVANV